MRRYLLVAVLAIVCMPAVVFGQAKRPLDHDAYDIWMGIQDQAISNDGRWVLYTLVPQDGDAELRVHSQISNVVYTIPRGRSPQFTTDGQFVVTIIKPELEISRQARREHKRPNEQPKDSLGILNLSNGDVFRTEMVKSYKLPEDAGGWVAYLLEEASSRGESTEAAEEPEAAEDEAEDENRKEKTAGTMLVVRNLTSGTETEVEHVTEYAFASNGRRLVYSLSTKDGANDGVFVMAVEDANVTTLAVGEGEYKSPTFDESGDQVAFLSNRDDYDAEVSAYSLFHWSAGADGARALVTEATQAVRDGWWVSEHGDISFSDTGERLFFGTAPRPEPEVEDSLLDEERVKLDIWNWQDPYIQPMQLIQANRERRRTYLGVVHLESGDVVQLATPEVPMVEVGQDGDAKVALGRSDLPYRQLMSWDTPGYNDYYLVDVATGSRQLFHERLHGTMDLSPNGTYAVWWDNQELAWYGRAVDGGQATNLTKSLPYPVHNEDHDWPYRPNAYGNAGWTEDDGEFLVYDRYDIWALDPAGQSLPRCITDGFGRRENLRFRYVDLDRENETIASDQPMTLSVFNTDTKASGFYRDRVNGRPSPRKSRCDGFSILQTHKGERRQRGVVYAIECRGVPRSLGEQPRVRQHAGGERCQPAAGRVYLGHRRDDGVALNGWYPASGIALQARELRSVAEIPADGDFLRTELRQPARTCSADPPQVRRSADLLCQSWLPGVRSRCRVSGGVSRRERDGRDLARRAAAGARGLRG